MKVTIETFDVKYSVEMPDEVHRDDFMDNVQCLVDCLWYGSVLLEKSDE